MKTNSVKMAIKSILIVAIIGFAIVALTGCGIGYGPYRHGYGGRHYNNAENYRGGYDYSGDPSNAPTYNPDNRGYGPMMGYDQVRSGNCMW